MTKSDKKTHTFFFYSLLLLFCFVFFKSKHYFFGGLFRNFWDQYKSYSFLSSKIFSRQRVLLWAPLCLRAVTNSHSLKPVWQSGSCSQKRNRRDPQRGERQRGDPDHSASRQQMKWLCPFLQGKKWMWRYNHCHYWITVFGIYGLRATLQRTMLIA